MRFIAISFIKVFQVTMLYLLVSPGPFRHKLSQEDSADIAIADSLFNVFRMEAANRNFIIPRSDVAIRFTDMGKRSGSCRPNSTPKIISLDTQIWRTSRVDVKEKLLFHELAHCILNRGHNNHTLAGGECKSWMREDSEICKLNLVNSIWRQYYIDELFLSDSLSQPSWYDFSRRPDTTAKLISTRFACSEDFMFSDTINIEGLDHCSVVFHMPAEVSGYRIFWVNEYVVQYGFSGASGSSFTKTLETILLSQYQSARNNLFSERSLEPVKDRELTVERDHNTIFVFLDSEVILCVPLSPGPVNIRYVSSFKESQNRVDLLQL